MCKLKRSVCLLLAVAFLCCGQPSSNQNDFLVNIDPKVINILVSLSNNKESKVMFKSVFDSWVDDEIELKVSYVQSDIEAILKLQYNDISAVKYDIALLGSDSSVTLYELGLVESIEEIVKHQLGINWVNSISADCLQTSIKDGEILSLPFARSRVVIAYNGDSLGDVTLDKMINTYNQNGIVIPQEVLVRLFTSKNNDGLTDSEKPIVNIEANIKLLEQLAENIKTGNITIIKSTGIYNDVYYFSEKNSAIIAYKNQLSEQYELTTDTLLYSEHTQVPAWNSNIFLALGRNKSLDDTIDRLIVWLLKSAPGKSFGYESLGDVDGYTSAISGLQIDSYSKAEKIIEVSLVKYLDNPSELQLPKVFLDDLQGKINSF